MEDTAARRRDTAVDSTLADGLPGDAGVGVDVLEGTGLLANGDGGTWGGLFSGAPQPVSEFEVRREGEPLGVTPHVWFLTLTFSL